MDRPSFAAQVDLNADAGEGFGHWQLGDDAALLTVVTSANIACGFHAGDPDVLRRSCDLAAEHGVSVGAQVSYPDLVGFGRRYIAVPPDSLVNDLIYQIGALAGICRAAGTTVRYVKAHGALYHRAGHDPDHARALVEAIRSYDPELALLCQAGSEVATRAAAAGVRVVREAFADRAYTAAGTLVPRSEPGAVITDAELVARRAVRMVVDGVVESATGVEVDVAVDSLCVHGDTPGAVGLARAVRQALLGAGISLAPFAGTGSG